MTLTSLVHPGRLMWLPIALSRKSGMIACFDSIILRYLERLDVELYVRGSGGYWASMRIESNLIYRSRSQRGDGGYRLCVLNDQALREKVMTEAHSSPFTIHPAVGDSCVEMGMNFHGFVTGLPIYSEKTMMRFGWLLVDRLTKLSFLPFEGKTMRSEVTSRFGKGFTELGEFVLGFSTAFHPQTDGQSRRTFRLWKLMLRLVLWVLEGFAIQRSLNVLDHRGKLSPDSSGPFGFFGTYGEVSYRYGASSQLSHVHDVFMYLFEGIPLSSIALSHLIPFDQIQY
ncbi:hypothetical protein Tco_0086464 [Tanacetum coccineum]